MNKKIILILLIIIGLFITACDQSGMNRGNEERDFYKGNEGLRLEFIPNVPPNKLYYSREKENPFPLMVKISNEGAVASIGNFFISGYDPSIIQLDDINPGYLAGNKCKFSFDSFRDFSKIGMDCGVGSLFFEDGFSDFDLSLNRIGFTDLCNMIASKTDSLSYDKCKEKGNTWYGQVLDDFDINVHKNDGSYEWSAINDNVALINDKYGRGTRFLMKGSILLGTSTFSDPMAKTEMLNGDSLEYYGGEEKQIDFSGYIKQLPEGIHDYNFDLQLTSCYLYSTIATPDVCIDPNPYSTQRKSCTPQRFTSVSGGQGAPVAITNIQQETTPNKIVFTLTIQNVGMGEIFNYYELDKCSPYSQEILSPMDVGVVYIEDIRVSGVQLSCTPSRMVRLNQNGMGYVTCTLDSDWTDAVSAYSTPLYVELGYGYRQSILKNMIIRKI